MENFFVVVSLLQFFLYGFLLTTFIQRYFNRSYNVILIKGNRIEKRKFKLSITIYYGEILQFLASESTIFSDYTISKGKTEEEHYGQLVLLYLYSSVFN